MKIKKISDQIYYIGTNDRRTALFENNWPIPYGVSYNSYLIKDEKNVLIDTIEYGSDSDYFNKIEELINGEKIDYLVVNHMEPDHSGMIPMLQSRYPNIKIVGNEQTFKLLNNYYGIARESFVSVKDGEELSIGKKNLKFVFVPWVHWPETMVTYLIEDSVLFSCDAFGGYGSLDGGIFDDEYNFEEMFLPEMRRYYSNIVARWSNMVIKALDKLNGTPIKIIAPSHGVVWRENPSKVIDLYSKWAHFTPEDNGVLIVYASMYGNTAHLADTIGEKLNDAGVKNIRICDASRTHASYILSDIQKYKGFILGTCAYNTYMHPMMEHICNEIKIMAPKNKTIGIFGTSGWNGAGVKSLLKFAEDAKLEVITPTVEALGAPTKEKIEDSLNTFINTFIEHLNK